MANYVLDVVSQLKEDRGRTEELSWTDIEHVIANAIIASQLDTQVAKDAVEYLEKNTR